MVVRSPALLSLGLAAFLRSLLPAQPAPCPHGAGARAAFRKPSCIFPAPRLRGGPLGPQVGSGDSEQNAWEAGAATDPRLTPKSEQPESQGAGDERGWGTGPSESPGSGEQVGRGAARSAQRPHAYPGPAHAEQREDTRVRLPDELPSKEGQRGTSRGRVGSSGPNAPTSPAGSVRGPRGSPEGSCIETARVRAPSQHAGRPGPLSVQTAAPADARAPIGAPRPPPAAPEAPGPQLLGRDLPRPCASARPAGRAPGAMVAGPCAGAAPSAALHGAARARPSGAARSCGAL